MNEKEQLLNNIDKLHTTPLGAERIRRNLALAAEDVVAVCREKVMDAQARVYREGKNWYCEVDGVRMTIHAHSYTIITAHRIM